MSDLVSEKVSEKVRIAMIGAGAVADYHHVPGIMIDPRAELVAVCDPNEALLGRVADDDRLPGDCGLG